MDLTIWYLIFGVLTCLDGAVSGRASPLSSPENVTVDCDNFDTMVYWNYSDLLIEPLFQLELKSDISDGPPETFKTMAHHANITSRLKNTNYVVYTIRIQAKNGTHSSSFSPPVKFAFDNRMKGNILCNLDFPPVTLKYAGGELTLSFKNPIHLYENTPALKYLKDNKDPNLETSELKYEVVPQSANDRTSKSSEFPEFSCPYEKSVCAETLHIPDEVDRYCVNMSGRIVRANVRPARVCAKKLQGQLQPSHIVGIACVIVTLIGAIIVLGGLVWWKNRAKTHPVLSVVPDFSGRSPAIFTNPRKAETESFSTMYVKSSLSATSEDPLLSIHSSNSSRSSADCSRFTIRPGLVTPRERGGATQVSDGEELNTVSTDWPSDRSGQDRGLSETSGGTLSSDYDSPHAHDSFVDLGGVDAEEEVRHGTSEDPGYQANLSEVLSSGGTALSGYDSPQDISVELAPGDFVDGYAVDGACSESEDAEGNGERAGQDRRGSEVSGGKALSDYDSAHDISVELVPGDLVNGYTARERLA
ncbi:interferon gamma receptor 1 [Sardina pilchardus]|uniref:interferon gamma receptor 1 n=1 Tax=Sardina pilchardus TaxID=27697 RepID=UPI002E10B141